MRPHADTGHESIDLGPGALATATRTSKRGLGRRRVCSRIGNHPSGRTLDDGPQTLGGVGSPSGVFVQEGSHPCIIQVFVGHRLSGPEDSQACTRQERVQVVGLAGGRGVAWGGFR